MNYLKYTVWIFIVSFSLTLPFPLNFNQNLAFLFEAFFSNAEQKFCSIIGLKLNFQGHFYSDSIDLLVHCLFLFLFSILASFLLLRFYKRLKIDTLLLLSSSYILAFFLVKYGLDKLFKMQFYYPEPNILHTPFGQLDKDILYWSTIGKSYSYNVFLALIELIPGILLLHSKTRKLGGLIAFGVLIHVLMLNISYQIEVKILSSFLILLSLCILSAYWKELFVFFFQAKNHEQKNLESLDIPIKLKRFIKFTLVFYIFFEATFLAFSSRNFNDDLAPRPKFHGSYEIQSSSEELSDFFHLKSKIKRFFIHRKAYFILQTENDEFLDFKSNFSNDSYFVENRNVEIKFQKLAKKAYYRIYFSSKNDKIPIIAKHLEY